jgi:hypothetical protein
MQNKSKNKKTDAEIVAEIDARQRADLLAGRDPACTLERLRKLRAELKAAGHILPRIKKLSRYTVPFYGENAAAKAEILS